MRRSARRKRLLLQKMNEKEAESVAPAGTPASRVEAEKERRRADYAGKEDLYWRPVTPPAVPRDSAGETPAQIPSQKAPAPLAAAVSPAPPSVDGETPKESDRGRPARPAFDPEKNWGEFSVESILRDIFGHGSRETAPKPAAPAAPSPAPGGAPADDAGQALQNAPSGADGRAAAPSGETDSARPATPVAQPTDEDFYAAMKAEEESDRPALLRSLFPGVFANRAEQRKKTVSRPEPEEGDESAPENLRLLLDLDYETELGHTVGYERIRDFRERATGPTARRRTRNRRYEYDSHGQDAEIGKFYAKGRKHHILALSLSFLVLVFTLILETPAVVARFSGDAAESGFLQVLYVLIGFLLLSVDVLMLFRQLSGGFFALLHGTPNDDSLCSLSLLFTVVYHMVLLLAPVPTLRGACFSPMAALLSVLSLSNLLSSVREAAAFRVASSRRQKYALLDRASVGDRTGDARLGLLSDENDAAALYARPVGFIRNYFANTAGKNRHHRVFGYGTLLLFAVAFLFAVLGYLRGGSLVYALQSFFMTFMISLPAVLVLSSSVPLFFVSVLRLRRKSAIIGEETLYNRDGVREIVLPDSEVFEEMPHERLEMAGGDRESEDRLLLYSLLREIGSPLCASVAASGTPEAPGVPLRLTDIDEAGVTAVTGDGCTLLFGSAAYLRTKGVAADVRREGEFADNKKQVLCFARDGRLCGLFLARYRLRPGVLALCRTLTAERLTLCVRTKDPGINRELLRRLCRGPRERIGVKKPLPREMDLRTDRVDADVVALDSGREAARAFALCRRTRRAVRHSVFFSGCSVFFGLCISGLYSFLLGRIPPALIVTLHAFFWCAAAGLCAYLFLREKKEEDGE